MTSKVNAIKAQSVEDEVFDLERRLEDAKARLVASRRDGGPSAPCPELLSSNRADDPLNPSANHFLLLLSDTALPLGSFAFSSGLESYLAHIRPPSFSAFLRFSLSSYASTTLPFVLAAHRNPVELLDFDDCFDAAIMCTVGRRASVAQGRALLSIWDRSFSAALPAGASMVAAQVLKNFTVLLRSVSSASIGAPPPAAAHLGPIFGAIASILGLSLRQTAYIFMLSHVKALLSAAVRASIFGPYHAQKLLASVDVQEEIRKVIGQEWDKKIEDAGQSVPIMDLWMGRHELLYSRIFNS